MKTLQKIAFLVVVVLLLGSAAPPVDTNYGSRTDRSAEELKLYTEALSALIIHADTARSRQLAERALAVDSLHTPSIVLRARTAPTHRERWHLYERALRSDPTNGFVRERAAESAARAGERARAIELYNTMVDTTTNLEIIHSLAMLHLLSNNFDESLSWLDTLDTRFGYSEATSKMRQHIYGSQGRSDLAEQEALKLYNESPYDAYNIADLAEFYEQRGSLEKALELSI